MESQNVALEFLREGQRHQFAEPPNDLAAETAYRAAVQTAPEWGEPYHWLGAILERQGKTKEAVECTSRRFSCSPVTLGLSLRLAGYRVCYVSIMTMTAECKPGSWPPADPVAYVLGDVTGLCPLDVPDRIL
jgi:hypothetical protein